MRQTHLPSSRKIRGFRTRRLLIDPDRPVVERKIVCVENGKIVRIIDDGPSANADKDMHIYVPKRSEKKTDDDVYWIVPGLIDIHNHGFGHSTKSDVLDYWTEPNYTTTRLPKYGVTGVLPTLTFPSRRSELLQKTYDAIEAIEARIRTEHEGSTTQHTTATTTTARPTCKTRTHFDTFRRRFGARVLGIHGEGPIIRTYGGLPDSGDISKRWSFKKFKTLLDRMPSLKIMTMSPSLETEDGLEKTKIEGGKGRRCGDKDTATRTTTTHACFACAGDGSVLRSLTKDDDAEEEEEEEEKNRRPRPFERLRELLRRGIMPSLGHDKMASLSDILQCLRCVETRDGEEGAKKKDATFQTKRTSTMTHNTLTTTDATTTPSASANTFRSKTTMHLTHAFNVMKFHHRDVGLANIAMCRSIPVDLLQCLPASSSRRPIRKCAPDVLPAPTVEVIADFRHVHPIALQALFDARGVGKTEPGRSNSSHSTTIDKSSHGRNSVCIVSDAIASPDAPIGAKLTYAGTRVAYVQKTASIHPMASEACVVDERGVLCGSCDALVYAFRRLVRVFGFSIGEAVRLCSTNPSRVAGVNDRVGTLDIGKYGDFVLFDKNLEIVATVVGGVVVYSR
eukprot:g3745.t1